MRPSRYGGSSWGNTAHSTGWKWRTYLRTTVSPAPSRYMRGRKEEERFGAVPISKLDRLGRTLLVVNG